MIVQSKHIISRFRWDTSFDQKDRAADLQARLSNWSRNRAEKEICRVLDKACPHDQVWTIQSLELDLGVIDFNELESELDHKLTLELSEKLYALIHHTGNKPYGIVEISDQYLPGLRLLSVYFLHGVLPWYSSSYKPVNEILHAEMKRQGDDVLAMFRSIAFHNPDVRKRMASQLTEPNIIRIIRSYEPTHSSIIINFANVLATLQAKNAVIRSGAGDLKRNIWLWVFNYLFTLHPSAFNRLAFLKSCTRQMAAHYNLTYEELLQLIGPSVQNLNEPTIVMKELEDEKLGVIKWIKDVLTGLQEDKPEGIKLYTEEDIDNAILDMMITARKQNTSEFLESLLAILYLETHPTNHNSFKLFIQRLLKDHKNLLTVVPAVFVNNIAAKYTVYNANGALKEINELIHGSQSGQFEVCRILRTYVDDPVFVQLKNTPGDQRASILNYLIKDGESFMTALVTEYTGLLFKYFRGYNRNDISDLLKTLFWKCILNFHLHKGRKDLFLPSFRAAIVLSIPGNDLLIGDAFSIERDGKQFVKNSWVLLEQCLEKAILKVTENGKEFYLDTLMNEALRNDPDGLKSIFKKINVTPNRIDVVRAVINFGQFCDCFCCDLKRSEISMVKELKHIYELVPELLPGGEAKELESACWKALWTITHSDSSPSITLKKLAKDLVSQMKTIQGMDIVAKEIKDLVENMPSPTLDEIQKLPTKKLSWTAELNWLDDLCDSLIHHGKESTWYNSNSSSKSGTDLMNELLDHYPIEFLRHLRKQLIAEAHIIRLSEAINFNVLASSISKTQRNLAALAGILVNLHDVLGHMTIGKVSSKELQALLTRKVLEAWIIGNFRNVRVDHIWFELYWDLMTKKKVSKEQLLMGIGKCRAMLQAPLQHSFDLLNKAEQTRPSQDPENEDHRILQQISREKGKAPPARDGITVKNAGLVLVNSYIMLLLERLNLLATDKFIHEAAQADAVHYLQYIVTGLTGTEEVYLPLNKVLCGLPLSYPVAQDMEMPEGHQQMIDAMIGAMISHWTSIGDSSVNGFRGNWLVRDGLLTELEDKWELSVENRAYDILLQYCPFTFSVIKYPWMNKPLHVNWAY